MKFHAFLFMGALLSSFAFAGMAGAAGGCSYPSGATCRLKTGSTTTYICSFTSQATCEGGGGTWGTNLQCTSEGKPTACT